MFPALRILNHNSVIGMRSVDFNVFALRSIYSDIAFKKNHVILSVILRQRFFLKFVEKKDKHVTKSQTPRTSLAISS